MWARWSHIQSSLFPWLREEIEPMTELLGRLITILDVAGVEAFVLDPPRAAGRPQEDRRGLARAFVAKAVFGIPTTRALMDRLGADQPLRRVCGWERRSQIPSEATFSRAFSEFAQGDLPDKMHAELIERTLGGRIIGTIARDATEIEAREKPAKKADAPQPVTDGAQPASDQKPESKQRRPRDKAERPAQEPTRLERQAGQTLSQMLAELPAVCDVGTKKNSKGYKETWIGYKLHIDVANGQIPVSCVLTSASVHDSQVAVPLMRMTSARVTYLYELMDSAYDAGAIAEQSKTLGHVALIDRNFRRQHEAKAECAAETARLQFIAMPNPGDRLYDFRTMVERVNGRLKDEFGGRFVRVRGAAKVKCHLMFGILALAADQVYRLGALRSVTV
jgi:transposase